MPRPHARPGSWHAAAWGGLISALTAVVTPLHAQCSSESGLESAPLLELYTSEGCSSCPPADRWLSSRVAADPSFTALAFHVDYWDRLGWKDPFSSDAATARQNAYAKAWGTRRLYTPQMVVNGREEFVGSSEAQADAAVAAALKRPATVALDARAAE